MNENKKKCIWEQNEREKKTIVLIILFGSLISGWAYVLER